MFSWMQFLEKNKIKCKGWHFNVRKMGSITWSCVSMVIALSWLYLGCKYELITEHCGSLDLFLLMVRFQYKFMREAKSWD